MDDPREDGPDGGSRAGDSDGGSGPSSSEEEEDDDRIDGEEGSDDPSEYSFYQSEDEDEEDDGGGLGGRGAAPPPPPGGPAAFAAGAKRKANGPLAELDQILDECNVAFPELVNQNDGKKSPTAAAGETQQSASAVAAPAMDLASAMEADASATTSTLKAGVGYETGKYTPDAGSLIKKNMCGAAKKQQDLDDLCLALMKRLVRFIKNFDGLFGMVLLALKLSPGFNRMLFSLLLNDSLRDWVKRKDLYDAVLDLLDTFSSQFYVGILLHNLLEGDGTPDNGKSNCQALLETVNVKAVIMNRSQQRMKGASASGEAQDTLVIQKIIATYEKVNDAIRSGREAGIIADPDRELTSKDVAARHPHLDLGDEDRPPPTEREDMAAYVEGMKGHRLRHVPSLAKSATYSYLAEATRASQGAVKKSRMLRVASEIAGLATDLPCEWSSGIYVRVDEDRPDILKACIVAPEGTPYENGCFEFDVFLPLAYPEQPPKVNLCTTAYKSVRFNPNLYNDGKVCLSLLGTWEGPGWLPDTSTLLQVLLSIQSLIFVPDPFFNEPGYSASQAAQQQQSKQYDRQIRAATLKVAILGQMKKPSELFQDCIGDHFRLKKRRILKQLDEWEELERRAAAPKPSGGDVPGTGTGAAGAVASSLGTGAYSGLVAGGGIVSSVKIVKGLCEKIRAHIEKTWPDKKIESVDE